MTTTTRHRHQPSTPPTYTVMPGGAKLTFEGYLPAKPCPGCDRTWSAAAYAKTPYCTNGRRWMPFGERCLQCDPPNTFPVDLHGVRPTGFYLVNGRSVGWYQRTRAGVFGPMLPLEEMGLRQMETGEWRPQPRLDRSSKAEQARDRGDGPLFGGSAL